MILMARLIPTCLLPMTYGLSHAISKYVQALIFTLQFIHKT